MNAIILSDCGSVCPCGGKFKTKDDFITKIKYPACTSCQMPPRKLRVRKNFPDQFGNVFKKDYSTFEGKALDSILVCVELIGQLNKEIHSPEFRLEKFSAKAHEQLKFENVANEYIAYTKARRKLPQEHDDYISPGGRDTIISNVKNHLIPYFNQKKVGFDKDGKEIFRPYYIYEINDDEILEFHKSYTDRFRARDKALGELKTLINYAIRKKYRKDRPNFPKTKKAKEIRASEIPDLNIQEKIINAINDEQYRDMYILTSLIACRPSETCSIHVEDVDYPRGGIWIKRHISRGEIESGRKSIRGHEEMGIIFYRLDDFMLSILRKYTHGKMPNDPLFPGKIGKYVSLTTFRAAWNRARKLVGSKVKSYIGTKHATLTDIRTRLGKDAVLRASRHKDERTALRYGKDKSELDNIIVSDRFALMEVVGK